MNKPMVIGRDYTISNKDNIFNDIFEKLQVGPSVIGKKVVLKPNLCTERKEIAEVANTSLIVIENTVKYLKNFTNKITIGESDGMRYSANEAFKNNSVYELGRKYDVDVLNFTQDIQIDVSAPEFKGWGFSKTFIESDIFITLPKLKTHATTYFTGALKNQWGCVPRSDRILLHKNLNRLIGLVNKIKKPDFAIMDGIIGMEGRGPINGTPVKLNVVLASNDPVAIDVYAMKLVSLVPEKAIHVQLAADEFKLGEKCLDKMDIDDTISKPVPSIEKAKMDWAIRTLNIFSRSEFMTKTFIMNDTIFYPLRKIVQNIRKIAG